MPAATAAPPRPNGQQQQAGPVVAFIDGTYDYSEVITRVTLTPTAATQELPVVNIIPGGFLKGVLIDVNATGGVIGAGVVAADYPWNIFQSITLESIDGTPMLYPMDGYSAYLVSRYTRPWDGDPALDSDFSASVNPSFRLRYFVESRATLGVVPNTDARAQYRLRATMNTQAAMFSTLPTTNPTITFNIILETYAQPPDRTLTGATIQQLPDGIGMQRFVSSESGIALNTGTTNVKLNRTGNLVRSHILVVRTSAGARVDLTADPIRFRVDNTQLFVEDRARRDYEMFRFFQLWSQGAGTPIARPTGVYVFPRWQQPGEMRGQGWLETTEATYLQYELAGGPASGTLQIITEDLAPVGPVPQYLEHI
jgi:hypothetical protein